MKYRNRAFTTNNDALGGYIIRSIGEYGVNISLNIYGKMKLWLNLKNGFQRALQITPTRHGQQKLNSQQKTTMANLVNTANLNSNACKVLSWNVSGITDKNIGTKLTSPDFVKMLYSVYKKQKRL